jgi:CheY-like chemotaxis protein
MSTEKKVVQGSDEAQSLEKRADDIMRSVLGLDRSQLADVYRSQTLEDPSQKLYDLATIVEAEYRGRGEAIPSHVRALLRAGRQHQLPLEGLSLECSIPKILLVDAEGERMLIRRTVFETHRYRVEMAFSLAEALEKLETQNFQAVIIERFPGSPEDLAALQELQAWNIQIPIINVAAWSRLARHDERHFNWDLLRALARAFGRPLPRKLPERKPVTSDSQDQSRENLFGTTGI